MESKEIPKIIHRCWFGPGTKSETILKCERSLAKTLPGYELKLWTDSNCPDLPFAEECRKAEKWALLSDYVRLYVLLKHGGIYLDTDVEVLKPFDDLLVYPCFLGFEEDNLMYRCLGNAVMGAIPNHPFIRDCYDALVWSMTSRIKPFYGVKITNVVMFKRGLAEYGTSTVAGVRLLAKEYLHPARNNITAEAYCIHWLEGSWHRKRGFSHELSSAKYKLQRFLGIVRRYLANPAAFRALKYDMPDKWTHREFLKTIELTRTAALNGQQKTPPPAG